MSEAVDNARRICQVVSIPVKTDAWKQILMERGWLDMYLPRAQYAAYIKDNQASATAALKAIG